jgi:hypothetical protein
LDRLRDIVNLMYPEIVEVIYDLALDLLVDISTNEYVTGFGQLLKPGGNVDAVAIYCTGFRNDIAEIYAHAKSHAAVLRQRCVSLGQARLYLYRAFDRLDGTDEFDKQAVAGRADDTSMKPAYPGLNHLAANLIELCQSSGFIPGHEPGITGDIGSQYRSEATLHGTVLSLAFSIPTEARKIHLTECRR